MAANPPDGALIDYVLPAGVQGPVVVTILDANNQLVRRYSSAEHVPPLNPATLLFAPEWVPPTPIPLATPGMQRFVWDFRYAKAAAPGAKGPSEDGVWAPPGRYTVELTVDGRDYRQALLVKPDPRVNVTEAALVREFELARKVEAAQLRASAALGEAVSLLNALDARRAQPGPAQREIAALFAKATDISGSRPHPDRVPYPAIPPLRTDSLQALSSNLDDLQIAVDRADADPSPDALASYALLSQQLTATLAEWAHLQQVDVPKLNRRLQAAGEKPI
jgi:hypothetical protein